ncbi:tRNA (guanine-N(7)-)-methyltransferase (tRNA(m7G46)-methyltransferase), variant 2 [Balamuthia mandrillaris]
MEIKVYSNGPEYLEKVDHILQSSVLTELLMSFLPLEEWPQSFMLTVESKEDGQVLTAAIVAYITDIRILLFHAPPGCVHLIVDYLLDHDIKFPNNSVAGPSKIVREFCRCWARRTGYIYNSSSTQRVYGIQDLPRLPDGTKRPAGRCRKATTRDAPTVARLYQLYMSELSNENNNKPSRQKEERKEEEEEGEEERRGGEEGRTKRGRTGSSAGAFVVNSFIEQGKVFLWENNEEDKESRSDDDGESICSILFCGDVRKDASAEITLVYTLEEKRGHGCASALVSDVAKHFLMSPLDDDDEGLGQRDSEDEGGICFVYVLEDPKIPVRNYKYLTDLGFCLEMYYNVYNLNDTGMGPTNEDDTAANLALSDSDTEDAEIELFNQILDEENNNNVASSTYEAISPKEKEAETTSTTAEENSSRQPPSKPPPPLPSQKPSSLSSATSSAETSSSATASSEKEQEQQQQQAVGVTGRRPVPPASAIATAVANNSRRGSSISAMLPPASSISSSANNSAVVHGISRGGGSGIGRGGGSGIGRGQQPVRGGSGIGGRGGGRGGQPGGRGGGVSVAGGGGGGPMGHRYLNPEDKKRFAELLAKTIQRGGEGGQAPPASGAQPIFSMYYQTNKTGSARGPSSSRNVAATGTKAPAPPQKSGRLQHATMSRPMNTKKRLPTQRKGRQQSRQVSSRSAAVIAASAAAAPTTNNNMTNANNNERKGAQMPHPSAPASTGAKTANANNPRLSVPVGGMILPGFAPLQPTPSPSALSPPSSPSSPPSSRGAPPQQQRDNEEEEISLEIISTHTAKREGSPYTVRAILKKENSLFFSLHKTHFFVVFSFRFML